MKINVNLIYPIGSIYMSVNNTNPANIFGGTWEQIKDKFLLSAGDTYSAGTTGGSSTQTLSENNLPSHHHIVGAHSHGLNSHTHTYSKSATATGQASGNTGSTTLTIDQIPAHTHDTLNTAVAGYGGDISVPSTSNINYRAPTSSTGGGKGHTHSLNNHTHTITLSNANTGQASGSTANSTAFNTGDTGSGNAFDILPPYLAVYIWKRTA